jgi:hypothetical protein
VFNHKAIRPKECVNRIMVRGCMLSRENASGRHGKRDHGKEKEAVLIHI